VVMEFPNSLEEAISWAQSKTKGGKIFYCPQHCAAMIVPQKIYVTPSINNLHRTHEN
jgi:hypothetical protein